LATVKFDEGTKKETSLDLLDGEGIVFVNPSTNSVWRSIGMKYWYITLVITNKRVATIPLQPNKKNYPVESFYYKDIEGAYESQQTTKESENNFSDFYIHLNKGGNSTYVEHKNDYGIFTIRKEMSAKNIIKDLLGELFKPNAAVAATLAMTKTQASREEAISRGESHYTVFTPNYAKIANDAKNKDYSKMAHNVMRDQIVELINQCAEEAKK